MEEPTTDEQAPPSQLLLPRWRASLPGAGGVVVPGAAATDTLAKTAKSLKQPPSPHASLMPSPFASNSAWTRIITAVALVSVLALVCIALGPMQAGDDSDDLALQNTQQQLSARLKLREFAVSTFTLRQRDSLEVRFAYDDASAALAAAAGTKRDWIGAYCIDNEQDHAAVSVHDFIDLRHTGGRTSGAVSFGPIVNMRCSWQFRFVAGASNTTLATSDFVRFERGATEPLQIHLALTARAGEMRVHWVSAAVREPIVQFGTSADALTRTALATQSSYEATDMCQAPATTVAATLFRDPGQLFEAVLTELESEQTYYYRVGNTDTVTDTDAVTAANGSLSDVRHFTMPPRSGATPSASRTTSFFVFGDLNSPVGATEEFAVNGSCGTTMRLIERDITRDAAQHAYAAVMHVGDISYAKGSTFIWDQFGELIQGVAATLPYMVSVGNHDYGYLEGNRIDPVKWPRNRVFERDGTHGYQAHGECGVPLEKRFHMPDNGNGIYWYSFAVGLTHHVVLSGEHDFSRGSPMFQWLVRNLRSVDRATTPWLFVHMHRPMYCSVGYAGDYDRSLLYRDELEQLFSDFHVDAVFAGHYHSYERTCAVFDDVCYSDAATGRVLAPVHFMVGSGGANVDQYGYYNRAWRAQAFQTYGYGRVHIYNATHMHFEFVANKEDAVVDSVWVVSDHNWPNNRVRRHRWSVLELVGVGVVAVAAVAVAGVTLWRHRTRGPGYSRKLELQEVL